MDYLKEMILFNSTEKPKYLEGLQTVSKELQNTAFTIFAIITGIFLVIFILGLAGAAAMLGISKDEEKREKWKKYLKNAIMAFGIFLVIVGISTSFLLLGDVLTIKNPKTSS